MPKVICLRHCALSLLFLFALAVRDAQQMVNVGLDRHGLPHFLLCRAVLGIERLFLRRQLAAFFLYPENHSLGEWFKRGCCR